MTDPTVPLPQAEPAARRRRLLTKKRVIIAAVGVFVALAFGGAAYGAHVKGDAKAEEYANALDAWNDKRNELLGAPGYANGELWDFDDPTTKKSLAKQKVACDEVLTLRKSTAKNAADVPTAPDSFFKLLSSDDREAIKDSKARVKAVKAYAKAADKVLVQMHKDCVWNIRTNSEKEGDSGAKKIFDKAEDLLLKPGHSAGNYYCPSSAKASCLPASQAGRTKFAELILQAIKVDKAYRMKTYFAPGSCDSTSYAELCAALKVNLASFYDNLGDYSAVFKSIDPSNTKLKQEFEEMKKGNKAADKAFKAALFKAHPEYKHDYRVAKYPFWQEAYFNAAGVDAIVSLEKLRKAVLHLPGGGDTVSV
jgi:hypothetical protein